MAKGGRPKREKAADTCIGVVPMIEEVKEKITELEEGFKIVSFPNINGQLLHVKVGNPNASAADAANALPDDEHLKNIEDKIVKLVEENGLGCAVFVSHCFVDIKIIK